MSTNIYKDGDKFCIKTTATSEKVFLEQCTQALMDWIYEQNPMEGYNKIANMGISLMGWLPLIANIFCKFRGHETKPYIFEEKTITAGFYDIDVVASGTAPNTFRVYKD